jgi:alpha-L-fucosidase
MHQTYLLTLVLLSANFAAASDDVGEFAPDQSKLPVPPPQGAVVLLDGGGTNQFLSMAGGAIDWPIQAGALVSTHGSRNTNHVVSRLHFRDADIHVEFMLPETTGGNSGIYIHGNYELQIYNSYGTEDLSMEDIGSIYGFSKPLANACRKPGVWQVYDIRYRAPRRDAQGKITEEGSITAYLNGVLVQDNARIGGPRSRWHPFRHGTTPYLQAIGRRLKKTMTGPLFLQDHSSPVRFRNVWVRPLDNCAYRYEPKSRDVAQRDARMQWWREARFGMFVHWGLYSGLAGTWEGKPVGTHGGMEWIQQRVKADTDTYASCAIPRFKPKKGFARDWAKLAKDAGCQYLVFTTKHHDGFALHDSKVSDFDAGSVLNRDLVKEIVDACRAEGLRIGFYHSVIDWHHDQYAYQKSKQLPHPLRGKPYPNGTRDHAKYVDYLHAEVNELVSNYGPIDVMWWDYSSVDFQGARAWRAFDLIQAVRAKQPDIIMNNRLFRIPEAGFTGMGTAAIAPQLEPKYGDFITPEQHIPATGMPGVDWETCMTMNTTWGFSAHDHAWKSDEVLIRNLIDIASKGGNYLLNIGPKGDGSVPKESIAALHAIGKWMRANGESIYGTTASPFEKLDWGRSTQKRLSSGKTRLYLHVFDWPADGKLIVPRAASQPPKARLLANGAPLDVAVGAQQITITVPKESPDKIATVIALDVED